MYEQVAASRNRMAQQLSAANRHVTFLETALESRRGEVAAAMASMQALTQVSSYAPWIPDRRARKCAVGGLLHRLWCIATCR